MKKKTLYDAPEAELLVVRFERNILSGEWDNSIRKGTNWSSDEPEDGYGLD
ncbi:MAG: hypothetical protein IJ156_06155 [Bacteroidales bacterium]|nr:hypothetical protein [Bacteroidales bacterium]